MQNSLKLLFCSAFFISFHFGFSQEEGTIVKKGEVANPNSLFINLGPSFRLNNKSDYGVGFGLEVGYLKRLNRNLSISPSVSYTAFGYDQSLSNSFNNGGAQGNNIFFEPGGYEARVAMLQGGNLKLIGAGLTLRFNFIPVSELKKFSVYAFTKPALLMAMRQEISGTYDTYFMDRVPPESPSDYSLSAADNPMSSPDWGAQTEVTMSFNLGVGAEYRLPSGIDFYLQAAAGSTLPITTVRTSEFANALVDTGSGLTIDPAYPLAKKAFSTLAVSIGIAYNF